MATTARQAPRLDTRHPQGVYEHPDYVTALCTGPLNGGSIWNSARQDLHAKPVLVSAAPAKNWSAESSGREGHDLNVECLDGELRRRYPVLRMDERRRAGPDAGFLLIVSVFARMPPRLEISKRSCTKTSWFSPGRQMQTV